MADSALAKPLKPTFRRGPGFGLKGSARSRWNPVRACVYLTWAQGRNGLPLIREGILSLDQHMLDLWWNELGFDDISVWRYWKRSWSGAAPQANAKQGNLPCGEAPAQCHSERSEESRSAGGLLCDQPRARFLAFLRRKSRHSRESGNPFSPKHGPPLSRG